MKKGTIITFVLSVIIFFAIGTLVVLVITPEANPGVYTKVEYQALERNKYVFIPTRDVTPEGIIENHEIDREYLNNLEKNKGYKPRKNNNPFETGENAPAPAPNKDGTVKPGETSSDSPSNNPSSPNSSNNGAGNTNK